MPKTKWAGDVYHNGVYISCFLLIFMTGQFFLLVSVEVLHQCTHPVDPLGFLRRFSDFQYTDDGINFSRVKRELSGGGRHEKRE